MLQAENSKILLYANDSCLFFQQEDIKTIKEYLNRDFSILINWFVDNTFRVHFDEDKTKNQCSFLLNGYRKIGQIEISYKDVKGGLSWMCLERMPNKGFYDNAGMHKHYLKTKVFIQRKQVPVEKPKKTYM